MKSRTLVEFRRVPLPCAELWPARNESERGADKLLLAAKGLEAQELLVAVSSATDLELNESVASFCWVNFGLRRVAVESGQRFAAVRPHFKGMKAL